MNERIKKLRKVLDLTQQAFADKIGIKQNTIAKYETNRGTPTTAVISLICREFNVNETWLRTGEGEMFVKRARNEELAAFMNEILQGDPDFRQKFISVLSRMTPEEWEILEKKVLELAAEVQQAGPERETDQTKPEPETAVGISSVITLDQPFAQVAAAEGSGAFLLDSGHDEVAVKMNKYTRQADVILKVIGRSMEPTIMDGDCILVRRQPDIDIGEIGVFVLDGQGYLKKRAEDRLVSLNPDIADVYIGDMQKVECYGKYIGVLAPEWIVEKA